MDITNLAGNLTSLLTLTIEQQSDGSWLFTIEPQNMRSASDMVFSRIVEIGYKVTEAATIGTKEAFISDLAFNFEDGTSIYVDDIPVQITVNPPTGISKFNFHIGAYWLGNQLYVFSPVAETIQVYLTSGVLLYRFEKAAGLSNYPVDKFQNMVLIVQGGLSHLANENEQGERVV